MILSPGEAVVFYTDGVTEAENGDGGQFGLDRLRELFAAGPPGDAAASPQRCSMRYTRSPTARPSSTTSPV